MKTIADIPVLSGRNWTGHATEFQTTRAAIFQRVTKELGDLGQILLFHVPVVVPTSPAFLHEALVEKHKSFEKSHAIKIMFYPFAGNGLFTAEGDSWKRQRKLLSPLFHPAAIRSYAPTINAVVSRCLDDWKDGAVLDVEREMTRITMAVAAKVMFDADTLSESDELSHAIRCVFEYIADQSGSFSIVMRATATDLLHDLGDLPAPLAKAKKKLLQTLREPVPVPTAKRKELRKAIQTLDARIQLMIEERREKGETGREDLLSRLLAARDEDDGSFMNDRQVRDEAMTLFIAGHETTATSTTWAIYFLSRNPDVKQRLETEIAQLPGDKPTAEEAAKLGYTRGVFREALRLCPPAFAVDRVTIEDVEVGGYLLPKKTALIIPIHALHRREQDFPNPERFDPERFTPEAEAKRPKGAYLPFGLGPRVCIGAAFAELEAQIVLAQMTKRFVWEPVDTSDIKPDFMKTMRPESPIRIRVHVKKT